MGFSSLRRLFSPLFGLFERLDIHETQGKQKSSPKRKSFSFVRDQ